MEKQFFKIKDIPSSPGIYLMRDSGNKIIYIGKAKNLKKRVSSYFRNNRDTKIAALINSLRHIDYILASSEREALIVEQKLISKHQPYYNSMWRDDKSYPYLKLTLKEDFPRLILTRKHVKDGSEYFGPYPQVLPIKKLMKWLQRIFRFRPCKINFSEKELPQKNKVKSCLYLHTQMCPGPCVGQISSIDYKKNINQLRLFLNGKYQKLRSVWEKEMKVSSQSMDYEAAGDARDRLEAIQSMSERVTVSETKPEDIPSSISYTNKLEELKKELGLQNWPIIIEGFDISNTSGKEAVGSMVRFQNAKPDTSNYRKYTIKTVKGIDDFSMMREIVFRRYRKLKTDKAEMPDLVLIDGGKGQLSAATSALASLKLKIPIVSIAKKREEIFIPGKEKSLKLLKNSGALHVLQAVRDEAHRFAIGFHKIRRKKAAGI
ncbi:GIY-YIG nuclease family protein [Elusimicrobiota bacterium]